MCTQKTRLPLRKSLPVGMSLLGGKKTIKVQAARKVAKKAALQDCQATEGCGLPHAKIWEKGAAM